MIFLPQNLCLKIITLMYILLVSVADIYVDSCLLVLTLTCLLLIFCAACPTFFFYSADICGSCPPFL